MPRPIPVAGTRVHVHPVEQNIGEPRMMRAEPFLVQGQRALKERPRGSVLALTGEQRGEIIQHLRGGWMRRPQQVFGNAHGTFVQPTRAGRCCAKPERQAGTHLGGDTVRIAKGTFAAGKGLLVQRQRASAFAAPVDDDAELIEAVDRIRKFVRPYRSDCRYVPTTVSRCSPIHRYE